jgi:hypothetical protein
MANNSLTCCQIDWLCTHYMKPSTKFLGVMPASNVPLIKSLNKYTNTPIAFIANTDPAPEPGSHWLGFYRKNINSELECFDSFGMPASSYGYFGNSNAACTSTSVNHVQYQSDSSSDCGFYAIYYIMCRSERLSIPCILNSLSFYLPIPRVDSYVRAYVRGNWPFPAKPNTHCVFCCNQCSKPHNLWLNA